MGAAGHGSCREGAADYFAANGGCVDLVSTGTDPQPSEFFDADPTGKNVFIRTTASLDPHDEGAYDVYDARGAGGFALPAAAASAKAKPASPHRPPPTTPPPPRRPSKAPATSANRPPSPARRARCAPRQVRPQAPQGQAQAPPPPSQPQPPPPPSQPQPEGDPMAPLRSLALTAKATIHAPNPFAVGRDSSAEPSAAMASAGPRIPDAVARARDRRDDERALAGAEENATGIGQGRHRPRIAALLGRGRTQQRAASAAASVVLGVVGMFLIAARPPRPTSAPKSTKSTSKTKTAAPTCRPARTPSR